ncbi:MAG: hypothetical protein K2V38_23560 [Gemmataceae bacterium]|nr:hypothetical protein [Gemmataceae bacterium]
MARRKKLPPAQAPAPEPDPRQRLWQNGWGMTMAAFTLAPLRPDGTEPTAEGVRVWFEPPRHGWLFPHVELVGCGEFVCRASDVEGDFLGDLIGALRGVLSGDGPTRAEAFGEPQSFDFRFTRAGGIRCEVVAYNKFAEPVVEEPVLTLASDGDGVCRAFCFGIQELHRAVAGGPWGYAHPFPTDALAGLCAALGGEFAGVG